jgi:hypothetical protein
MILGFKSSSSLVELIETNVDLKKLIVFEKPLKMMKLWSFKFWIKSLL